MSQIEVTLIDSMGTDLSVVNAARVSFGKISSWNPDLEEKPLYPRDEKLIKYLASHKHISPFGHCFASFHVKAPIFVARQLVKHKFLRWNEISRRYVDDEPEFYVPDVWRGRSADKKQGSDGTWQPDYHKLDEVTWQIRDLYNQMIYDGCAPEQARMVLPQSTMTEWWWSGSLDAFASMCQLRCKEDTQYESRVVADKVNAIMGSIYPVSWKSLMENN